MKALDHEVSPGVPNPKVDWCFEKAGKWRPHLEKLRDLVLGLDLTEELKWGKPFYTAKGGNVLVLWGFKEHCALGFCKGTLMRDPKGILVKIGENSQAAKKVPFTEVAEIEKLTPTLKAYIKEATAIEEAGLEVEYKKTEEFGVPAELTGILANDAKLKKAWEALTPGRQRGWLLHFGGAKQAATRTSRIEKASELILAGKGMHDNRPTKVRPSPESGRS